MDGSILSKTKIETCHGPGDVGSMTVTVIVLCRIVTVRCSHPAFAGGIIELLMLWIDPLQSRIIRCCDDKLAGYTGRSRMLESAQLACYAGTAAMP